ncbi:hypothetical protein SAMN05421679_10665 [Epilithonimonas pallida]|uniref:Uncharacterized protein n=2 Tax=Epilithonimonas pallida TaxID=373671 RepID=A0ABY1R3W0_9FLAO|nr:hypothetical protein SAMN05421679_10665 [Epilithonimonas pallida]
MLIYYPAPATGLYIMKQIYLNIDIHHEAAKFLNLPKSQKLNVVFSLLTLKSNGLINNVPLIKFGALISVDIQLLIDKISQSKSDEDLIRLAAKYKMMFKYHMVSSEHLLILEERSNQRIDTIYRDKNFDINKRFFPYNEICKN